MVTFRIDLAPDDAPLIVAWPDDAGDWQRHDTGLRLTVIGEQAVIPFSSQENAVDCLRIVTEALRREQERE